MSRAKNTESRADRVFSAISKIFVWGLFFGILYLLRSFFLLIFLTFVFSYIQAHGVDKLQTKLKNRTISVVLICLSFFATLVLLGSFLVPRVVEQAKIFADKHQEYFISLDRELANAVTRYPVLGSVLSEEEKQQLAFSTNATNENLSEDKVKKTLSLKLIQSVLGYGDTHKNMLEAVKIVRNIGQPLIAIFSAFFLSLLFSFLILLDLPRLKQSMSGLSDTRLGFLYDEVAPSIRDFARVVGSAFEAQSLIALLNTFLTAGAIYILGVQKSIAFLCLIVFFCSFIPVAGVFISSVPICLMALQNGGFTNLLIAIALIWGVHIAEAYVLNPKIYGNKLKINPVLVLIILTVSGKLFHVWGLLLSLPVYTYIFGHAIQDKK